MSNIRAHLDKIENWASNWKIKINAEKSFLVPFTKKSPAVLNFDGTVIPEVTQIKYLGITLDKPGLTWGPHFKSTMKTLNSKLHLLRPILKSNLSFHNKIIICKSMLRPI